jgi:predicted glycosyltransferase
VDAVAAHDFGLVRAGSALVLVRPPSETSHYANQASHDLTHAVLARLAADPAVRVIFSPRHKEQVQELRSHRWSTDPIVLEQPVEFVSLLKAVDWVICAGGTMLREAAYLGVPAVSIFRSEVGAVDRLLEDCGAVRFVRRVEDLDAIDWHGAASGRGPQLPRHPEALKDLTEQMLERSGRGRRRLPASSTAVGAVR